MMPTKEKESNQTFPKGYEIARKERENNEDGRSTLLVKDNLRFQKILENGPFKQCIIGKVSQAKFLHV